MLRLVLSFVLLLFASSAQAELYLQLTGGAQGSIRGEVAAPGYENMIAITSFQWGAGRAFGQGGQAPSSLQVSEVTLSKRYDRSSLALIRAQGESELFTTFRLYLVESGQPGNSPGIEPARRMPLPGEYLQIELRDAILTSYSTSGTPVGNQSESISFSFSEIRILDASTGEEYREVLYVPARGAPGAGAESSLPRPMKPVPGVFDFELPADGRISVEIVDRQGDLVVRLDDAAASRDEGLLRWDGTDANGRPLPAGMYVATVRTSEAEITRRIVIGD